jgi:hypothetical protein
LSHTMINLVSRLELRDSDTVSGHPVVSGGFT